jgi:hypothetical protein
MLINKYAVSGHFGPFWAILGHFMSRIGQKLFPENKNPLFGDYTRFVACP